MDGMKDLFGIFTDSPIRFEKLDTSTICSCAKCEKCEFSPNVYIDNKKFIMTKEEVDNTILLLEDVKWAEIFPHFFCTL
jgi:hypothetical protein